MGIEKIMIKGVIEVRQLRGGRRTIAVVLQKRRIYIVKGVTCLWRGILETLSGSKGKRTIVLEGGEAG